MKVIIIDEQGKQVPMESSAITVNGRHLSDYFDELTNLKKEVKAFIAKSQEREKELVRLWRGIK